MTPLASWLRGLARRRARRPDLASALLAGRGLAYAGRRIGFSAARASIRTGLTALELQLLLLGSVPFQAISPLIAVRLFAGLAGAAHWGALEAMREQVRVAWAARERARARGIVERWLGVTALFVVLVAAGTASLALRSEGPGSFTLSDAYLVTCASRLGLESLVRVLHSGIFAVRRVYRPLWSVVLPDLVELVTLGLGFDRLGVWSIPLGIALAGGLEVALASSAVRRAYRYSRLDWPRLTGALRALFAARRAPRARAGAGLRSSIDELVPPALANLSLSLDALVLLVLLGARAPSEGPSLALVYYALWPLAAFGTQWVRTFYFDLKQIERGPLRALGVRLQRYLERLALGLSLAAGAITIALASFASAGPSVELLWLLPLFAVRSRFALFQLVSFAAGAYRVLAGASALLLLGFGLLHVMALGETQSLIGLLSVLTGTLALASRATDAARRALDPVLAPLASSAAYGLSLAEWFARLSRAEHAQLVILTLRTRGPRAAEVMRALGRAWPELAMARYGRRHLFAFTRSLAPITRSQLIVTTAGSCSSAWVSAPAAPRASLTRALQAGALPATLARMLRGGPDVADPRVLCALFRDRFPDGHVCDLSRSAGDLSTRAARPEQLRAVLAALRARTRSGRAHAERRLGASLAVYEPHGQPRLLFVVDRGAPEFAAFRELVQEANVRASWPAALAVEHVAAREALPA